MTIKIPETPALDFEHVALGYEDAITPVIRRELADRLGVSTESLRRLRIGWDGDAWTLPMFDGDGLMIGIQRRFPNGSKYFIAGCHPGLFVQTDLNRTGPLFVCEGASDTAAALTLGVTAIGRPNCSYGTDLVCRACKGRSEIVIISDPDEVGLRGARNLGESLSLYCASVKLIVPPVKDFRQWLQRGLTHEELHTVIDRTETVVQGVRCG